MDWMVYNTMAWFLQIMILAILVASSVCPPPCMSVLPYASPGMGQVPRTLLAMPLSSRVLLISFLSLVTFSAHFCSTISNELQQHCAQGLHFSLVEVIHQNHVCASLWVMVCVSNGWHNWSYFTWHPNNMLAQESNIFLSLPLTGCILKREYI